MPFDTPPRIEMYPEGGVYVASGSWNLSGSDTLGAEQTLGWCRGAELNCLRRPFQGRALPVSYPGTGGSPKIVAGKSGDVESNRCQQRSLAVSERWFYFTDSSNSRIQSFFFSTSRGLVPSGGPTMPSFSMMSISRAARP